jgi:hypothetical protein
VPADLVERRVAERWPGRSYPGPLIRARGAAARPPAASAGAGCRRAKRWRCWRRCQRE